MADGVDIDLYADDLDGDFNQDFKSDNVDLYDDVIAGSATGNGEGASATSAPVTVNDTQKNAATNGVTAVSENGQIVRRFQLYVGNLTWWTSDQDITDAIHSIGVNDFLDVKFFENRANGQSKGFCVITLGSDTSMRMCMERLPKKELYGQFPVVTYPTKQALSQFESQSKTRPLPPPPPSVQRPPPQNAPPSTNQPPQGPPMMNSGGVMPMQMQMMPPQQQQQMQQQQQQQMRLRMGPPPGMRAGPMMQQGPNRMPMQMQMMPPGTGMPNGPMQNQMQPNFQGPPRPGMPPQGMPPQGMSQRGPMPPPGMFQGPPQVQGMPPRGPPPQGMQDPRAQMRPDWSRPPGGPQQPIGGGGPMFAAHQGPPRPIMMPGQGPMQRGLAPGPHMQGPLAGMAGQGPPPQMAPAPHVNPAFFPPAGGPPQSQAPINPNMYGQPAPRPPYGGDGRSDVSLSEQEFEEIMNRNRSVSSSAIARAVADAAAGEYASAIETLVTAISLIRQSKAAADDRCKILVSSLQDTLHGIEAKSYGHSSSSSASRRERSRSRDRERSHRRRRERTRSRERDYRERSRERDHREKDRYYSSGDAYVRERSRSRERDRERDYRDRSREDSSARVNVRSRAKSPSDVPDHPAVASGAGTSSKSSSRYYEERYRERERDRDRDRAESSRHAERDRDRDRRDERSDSSHRSRH